MIEAGPPASISGLHRSFRLKYKYARITQVPILTRSILISLSMIAAMAIISCVEKEPCPPGNPFARNCERIGNVARGNAGQVSFGGTRKCDQREIRRLQHDVDYYTRQANIEDDVAAQAMYVDKARTAASALSEYLRYCDE